MAASTNSNDLYKKIESLQNAQLVNLKSYKDLHRISEDVYRTNVGLASNITGLLHLTLVMRWTKTSFEPLFNTLNTEPQLWQMLDLERKEGKELKELLQEFENFPLKTVYDVERRIERILNYLDTGKEENTKRKNILDSISKKEIIFSSSERKYFHSRIS